MPTITKKFKRYNSIGKEELRAATKVLKSGKLSEFLASWGKEFYGGKYVRQFESKLKTFYKVKHAIVLNSWTSGLVAAVGALDIEPGDEIIVTPWTMCATATAILHWNAIPVFVDINQDDYCINLKDLEKKITKKTKAIITVDIFGNSSNVKSIKAKIKNKNIKIISDSAQAPFTLENKKIVGTQSDIGGYSLNYHKHINTGEGGIIVTNNNFYADRVRLIRNHGEAVVEGMKFKKINNIIGHNFRMGEIEAAIGIQQLKKLKNLVKSRQNIATRLTSGLKNLKGIITPKIKKNHTHSFYVYPIVLDLKKIKYSRRTIFKKLIKEGVQGLTEGYIVLHRLPMFKKKIAYGKKHFPWSLNKKKYLYSNGQCPQAEFLHDKSFLSLELCQFDLTKRDVDLIINSFEKVWLKLKI
tara:strand:- start:251 stop:1486 length:1236 start_codon:yes stop_codon:yes gene_type:complete